MPASRAAEPLWLSAADIEHINRLVVAQTGESHSLTRPSLLESAAARPRNLHVYEAVEDVIVLGVRLIEAVGKNHCFVQGNKRTAFHAGLVFMELNDCHFDLPDTEATGELVMKLILGEVPADDLVELFRSRRL